MTHDTYWNHAQRSDKRVYVCAQGHRQVGEFQATAHSPDDFDKVEATSGPVCRVCYVQWIGKNCRTQLQPEPE